jgi:type VI secretion system secreted protein VgrG
VLLFHRMHARDEISRLSEYEIDLLSKQADIDLDKILAQKVTVKLELPAGKTRFFNGFVTRFVQVGMHGRYHLYRATVRPWLWFLTRTANCRIFQEMDVPDIVKKVFDTYAIADIKLELTETYAKREYCVQYRETDFNFVSRLLEDEGIYYFFRHVDGRHTMVLVDSYSGHTPFEGYAQIPFIPLERSTRLEKEFVYDWKLKREVQSGRFALDDFDFKKPSSDLQVKTTAKRNHDQADHEIFDYPGEYFKTGEGDRFVRARIDELQTQFELVSAQGNARGASVGSVFKLGGHPRGDQNREYLVLSSKYELEYTQYEAMENTGAKCSCHFTALDSKQQFRPQRTSGKTFVQGPQTAIVVGPAGDEIYTDEYGRVKVQFHWDRYGKNDENSSCWARVSHPWAGNNWGMIAIPRIGQEVIVDFLEGDPDRPLITGRVYNAEQMPPWELPANKTQTGVLTRSSLGGSAANANAIRFEDKKGDEQLWIHAEKNQDIEVENDETHWVGHDRKKTIDHDETTLVQHDRTETVGNNETITIGVDRTETVGRNETITVALMRTRAVGVNEAIAIGAAQEVVVGATRTLAVGIDQSTSIGNNHSVEVGSDQSSSIGDNRSSTVGKDDSLKVGKNLVIDAGDSVTIKTGSASITMKKDGTITIKGKDITINGSGKINVKASSDVVIKGAKILQN